MRIILFEPCLPSEYTRDSWGYAQVPIKMRKYGTRQHHRIVYADYHNYIFQPGDIVMHLCDNPPCIRVSHLVLGTQADNMKDMVRKGRQAHNKGEMHGMSKLTNDEVEEIKRLKNSRLSGYQVAERFKVSYSLIYQIWRGKIHND